MAPVFEIAPASADRRAPNWPIRPGGWDTHAHVFGPRAKFAFAQGSPYVSPDQTVEDYLGLLDSLGLARGVLVQPSAYGDDHACLLDALDRAGGRLVGVVDLDVLAISDPEVERLSAAGVCGMRLRWPHAKDGAWLQDVGRRLHAAGWHLDVLPGDLEAMADLAGRLDDLACPVVVEAMGGGKAGQSVTEPGFAALLERLREGRAWVKLSHAYHIDHGRADYPAAARFARAIVEAAPGQALWGSDWPHPTRDGLVPRDHDLLDLLPAWSGSVEAANAILCTNPARLYGARPSAREFKA